MARVDRCFKSQRPFQDNAMDHHYWYELPHNNYLKRNEKDVFNILTKKFKQQKK